ncbi:hexokinase-1 [Podospora fimiseda]|uniref:Phosphotransferase n=1 Tax=Podospora fimiseda TaxID=252190 RepID=A0AAN7BZQ7_9PEZI|nr:hexokinase-1 [Podospora fimiseda]
MASLRDVLMAALKSLLRGKSFLQALLTFWSTTSTVATSSNKNITTSTAGFLAEAEQLILGPLSGSQLRELSRKLKQQFKDGLMTNPACMLPSYNSQLPTGHEPGEFLALDVGGSTLRVALVELKGRTVPGSESVIVRLDSFKIDNDIRNLSGRKFFDWMAEKIYQTVAKESEKGHSPETPLLVGMAWSFPIEQTSSKGGNLSGMGKGFLAADGLLGQDLGEIIKLSCQQKGLHVELSAIVNDSSATLLSAAYTCPSTRFGLILGTGVNIAGHLPVTTIGRPKYGDRPDSWHEKASHVIVNTELGMFGKDILPLTRWDHLLKKAHPLPDFQPLEHLVSGYYLGEVCRHALLEAMQTTGVFGGIVPPSLQTPYSLDTETLSFVEADTSSSLSSTIQLFQLRHPSTHQPTTADLSFLRTLASYISQRSASIVAASLFALWELKAETDRELLSSLSEGSPDLIRQTEMELKIAQEITIVAFNGSVIENYPGYKENLQGYIDGLVAGSAILGGGSKKTAGMKLMPARESSLLGAAVALACLD